MLGKNTYQRAEKLKSRKAITRLFEQGQSAYHFPVKYIFSINTGSVGIRAGIGVSKKYFSKAVCRNRVKRLMREVYRTCNQALKDVVEQQQIQLDVFFLYTHREIYTYENLQSKMQTILETITHKILEREQSI